jgi:transcriptional regulator with XRE-family HTH domain
MSPATPSTNKADSPRRRKRVRQTTVREIRIKRGLTQKELGELTGMHRNSIRKIETGSTREVTADHAEALSIALETPIDQLGLTVRTNAEAPSIRFRRLTPEQRQIVNELLALPPADYLLLRAAMEELRVRKKRPQRRGGRR